MGKLLPIAGIVGCAFAFLSALVLVNAAMFLVLPIILAGSIVLLAQRNVPGAVAGLVVLAFAVVAAMGLAGSITREGGASTDFGIGYDWGRVLAILGCLAISMGTVAVRWLDAEPRWLTYAAIGTTALASILAAINRKDLADQSDVVTLFVGLLCLAGLAPMIALLRAPDRDGPAASGAP